MLNNERRAVRCHGRCVGVRASEETLTDLGGFLCQFTGGRGQLFWITSLLGVTIEQQVLLGSCSEQATRCASGLGARATSMFYSIWSLEWWCNAKVYPCKPAARSEQTRNGLGMPVTVVQQVKL